MPTPDPHVPQTEGLQIGDHTMSTTCEVVERPDHHCGYDLVFYWYSGHTGELIKMLLIKMVGN